MTQQTEILGAHVFAYRDGAAFTLPEPGGNAGREVKPAAEDPAWFDWGILDVTVQPQVEEYEVWAPAPGVKQLEDVIPYKRQLNLILKKTELDNPTLELLWGATALPLIGAGGQFNPMELGANGSKWWLKVQYYGRANTNLMTVDLYSYVKYDGDFAPEDGPVEPQLMARTLRSTLNTGTLA